jgi:hypothetical protein
MKTALRSVPQIDKDINAIHRQMRRLEKIDLTSAASWQDAWDKHPELHERECALYRERGEAQQIRDEKAHKIAIRVAASEQRQRNKKWAAEHKARTAKEKAAPEMFEALQAIVAWYASRHSGLPEVLAQRAASAIEQAIA